MKYFERLKQRYSYSLILLRQLVKTDFKLRYQGSVLGYLWSLLKPLLMFGVLYIVFVEFLKLGRDIEHFPVYLLLGIVIWSFFTEMTSQSLMSIVNRGDLIRKIKIPRWIVVISASISALINLCLNMIIIGVFMVINQVDITWSVFLLPFSLLQVYIFALGISFFLAAAYVKFRDVSNIWDVVIQAGFYATPIIYPLAMITNETAQKLLLMSPVAQAIQDARHNLVTRDTLTSWSLIHDWKVVIPIFITILALIVGIIYFKKQARTFAENL